MKKKFLAGLHGGSITIAGSLLLASCSSPPPSQTTTITVEAPATPDAKSEAGTGEIADLRTSDDIDSEKPAVATKKTNGEPTDRDVEDPVPAKKSAPSNKSASSNKSELLWYYDRAPTEYFTAFGGVNRRSLLNRKGAIVDYKHRFIEIPGSANERDGDLHKLQITLFPNGKEPWCAISRIVWPQGQTPGKLGFYNNSADGYGLRKSSDDFFPYQLRKTDIGYESAWLPQRGLDIRINSAQDSEFNGPIYRYNRDYSATKPAFYRTYEDEEG